LKVFNRLDDAPDEYRRLNYQVISLKGIVDVLGENLKTVQLSPADDQTCQHLIKGCNDILNRIQAVIDKYESIGKGRFRRIADYTRAVLSDATELQQTLNTQITLGSDFRISLLR
jgi:hypothetical protein